MNQGEQIMQDRFKFRYVFEKDFGGKTGICYKMPVFNLDDAVRSVFENKILEYTNFGYKLIAQNQCTGLKDKNGTLIYEGDIVKIEYYDFEIKHRIGIVEWEDDGFCITYHNPKDTKVSGCSLVDIVNGDKQEVIGNIYETPELIGGE